MKWREYFEKMLNVEDAREQFNKRAMLIEEVQEVVNEIRVGKTPDRFPAEMLP